MVGIVVTISPSLSLYKIAVVKWQGKYPLGLVRPL